MLNNNKTYTKENLRDVQKVFNDGVCEVFAAQERCLLNSKGKFNYSNESIGINHFWQAYSNNVGLDMSIGVPANHITIDSQDVVKIGDDFFRIVRIQYKDNRKPKYWVLSLSKEQFSYVEGDNNE